MHLKTGEAAARATAAARSAVEALQKGADPAEVARQQRVEWVEVQDAGRQAAAVDPALLARVFQLTRPQAGRDAPGAAELPGGDAAVIALRSVTEGQVAGAEAAARQVNQIYGRMTYDALVEALRGNANVEVFADRL
jgi:hypothetical protein